MGFSTDYSEVKEEYGLIPEGEYEVVIRNIEQRTTPNGSVGLSMSLVIRNDVDQKCKDRYVFHNLWKRREPTDADKQVQGYSFNQVMRLAKSAKLPSGKAFETVLDLCEELMKRPIRITIEHETYNEKERENVKYINESKFPDCKHVPKEKQPAQSQKPAMPPTPSSVVQPQNTVQIGDLSDFEEIISDSDVPF